MFELPRNPEAVSYKPQYNSIDDVIEHYSELTPLQAVIELTHVRFDNKQPSVAILQRIQKLPEGRQKNELQMLASIIIQSDVTDHLDQESFDPGQHIDIDVANAILALALRYREEHDKDEKPD